MKTALHWLCTATDRQLLAMFSYVPTAALEAIAMAAYSVVAERSLYGAQSSPGPEAA
jgi:hypothetical protein